MAKKRKKRKKRQMKTEKQSVDTRAEIKRMLYPSSPRGYLPVDLLLLVMAFVVMNRIIFGLLGAPSPDRVWLTASAVTLYGAAITGLSLGYLRRYVGDDIGWSGPSRMQGEGPRASRFAQIVWVLWGGTLVWVAATAGLRAVLVAGEDALGFDPWSEGVLAQSFESMRAGGEVLPMVLFFVSAVILVPIGEELLFRRSVYQIIIEGLGGETIALLGSGLLFAFTHGEPVAMLRAAIAGITYAYAYKTTHAALVPILMHAVFNLLAIFALIFRWSPWLMP